MRTRQPNNINVSSYVVGLLQVHLSAVVVDFVITSFTSITSIFGIVFDNTRFFRPPVHLVCRKCASTLSLSLSLSLFLSFLLWLAGSVPRSISFFYLLLSLNSPNHWRKLNMNNSWCTQHVSIMAI